MRTAVWQDSRAKEIFGKHDLKIVSIEDLIQYRMKQGDLVERIEEQAIQTYFGDFNFYAYKRKTY